MSGEQEAPRADRAAGPAGQEGAADEQGLAAAGTAEAADAQEQAEQDGDDVGAEHAWDSRRDLYRHSPDIMFRRSAQLRGSLVAGDQHGVSGGHVAGDVVLGGVKNENRYEYHFGSATEKTSGEIPAIEVAELAEYFVYPSGPSDETADHSSAGHDAPDTPWHPESPFGVAVAQLAARRIVIVSGSPTTGRRSAALMLLRAVGTTTYRMLDPTVSPGRLSDELHDGCGHLIADLTNNADRPLREHHIRALSEKLRDKKSHLVIVVGPHPVVEGSDYVRWEPPEPVELLRGHLKHKDVADRSLDELIALAEVQAVIGHRRPMADLAMFAGYVAAHACGTISAERLAEFGHDAAERQVREWFDSADRTLHDKAFLIALAAFDESPYR
ncbi:hypothetical protein [Yinghuangia soli]|uniref:Uncharacterized protein n=1 Tax=Yinghuangia soli TaxID=2908204 RepID=A0AA41Q7G9_9ACTN|nr:hypothetical protein [Yinghuangia soli]MCF2532631.1 hypothetical protein [Yinghuangia soli]